MTNKEKYKSIIFQQYDAQNNGLTKKQLIAAEMNTFNHIRQSIIRNELIEEGFIRVVGGKYYLADFPVMSEAAWNKCSENAAAFANIQFGKIFEKLISKSIAYRAAYASYGPSTRNTVAFIGSYINGMTGTAQTKEKEVLKRYVVQNILEHFLSEEKFDTETCQNVIKRVRAFYREEKQIVNYTYGNAQKWVNMAIKYYIIAMSCYSANTGAPFDFTTNPILSNSIKADVKRAFGEHPGFSKYRLFAVDSIMIDITTKEPYRVSFKAPEFSATCWSKSNSELQFVRYWNSMEENLKNNAVSMPFLWELNTWKPRENNDADGNVIREIRDIYFWQ